MMRVGGAALALLLLSPAMSNAQQVSIYGFGDAGLTLFSAAESFRAILGKASGPVYGGGVELRERQFFLSLGVQRFRKTGNRVFVFENQVYKLDVDDTITVTPLELTAGYRYRFRRSRLVPYGGAGLGWHRFEETSEHATESENVKKTYTGFHLLGGVELPLSRWLGAGVDAQYSWVPNAFEDSTSSVASAFDEHDLGGFTVRAKVIFGR